MSIARTLNAVFSGARTYKKDGPTTRNNNTLADDPHLSVPLEAGTAYGILIYLPFTIANATMDFKYRLNFGGTITSQRCTRYQQLAGVGFGTDNQSSFTSDTLINSDISMAGSASGPGVLIVYVSLLTGTADTFAVQWAQNTTDAGDCTVDAGAWMKVL